MNLSDMIRKGLAEKGVQEDPLSWGAYRVPCPDNVVVANVVAANVVGLALVGSQGTQEACRLFEPVVQAVLDGKPVNPYPDAVLQAFGFTDTMQVQKLTALNGRKSAEQIARMLETGELDLAAA